MESLELLLRLINERAETRWVGEQLQETFARGISMAVSEAREDSYFEVAFQTGLPTRDAKRREAYETSRPYTDEEKLQIVINALRVLFVEVPAVQEAAIRRLNDLGSNATTIVMAGPEGVEQVEREHAIDAKQASRQRIVSEEKFAVVLEALAK
jgi:hypothetical protein